MSAKKDDDGRWEADASLLAADKRVEYFIRIVWYNNISEPGNRPAFSLFSYGIGRAFINVVVVPGCMRNLAQMQFYC